MLTDKQRIKDTTTKLYSISRRILMRVNEINSAMGLFEDEIGELYVSIIKRLFEELGIILSLLEEEYSDENITFMVEQDIIFPEEGEEFSIFLYRKLFNKLLSIQDSFEPTPLTNSLENYFLDKLISMDNSFNKTFYKTEKSKIAEIIKSEYLYFLDNLHELFQFNFVLFFDEYGSLLSDIIPSGNLIEKIFDKIPSLYFIEPVKDFNKPGIPYSVDRGKLKKKFLTSKAWSTLYDDVHSYIHTKGYGDISFYYYFEWDNIDKHLKGYTFKKEIKLEHIVGYEKQIKELVFNTKAFIDGLPANNVLIYGYRGCGKTSVITALLNEYKKQGLRLVKITKEDMDDLPILIEILARRKEKFIISPDDLSYEEDDPEYKRHKVILDNMLDKCPKNVLIYATSNTQELVKFNKQFTTDDIRIDNRHDEEKKLEMLDKQLYDEKRALTDRFGLTLLFAKPDKEMYSKMVYLHAEQAGINIASDDRKQGLIKNYEEWTLYHGTPCGRSAQNFIGYLAAKEYIEKK